MHFARQVLPALAAITLALLPALAAAGEGDFDRPAGARLSQAKLARLDDYLGSEIKAGKIPGAVLEIRQRGQTVYRNFFGVRDLATRAPMTDDTIFRLHSMTKPITSVAAMLLIDQGKIKLDDPLSKYIPAFADAKVGVEKSLEDGVKALELVPLQRPITIRDLLRHTAGMTYGFYGDSLVRKTLGHSNIYDGNIDNAEFAARLARLPLAEQPGTMWDYGHATDILGRVLEVVSGQTLYRFEKQILLDPLRMRDTRFFLKDQNSLKRQARPVPSDVFEDPAEIYMKWQSGGGGMVTTLRDFVNFAQMLLDGGVFEGKRILSEDAFAQMTTDQIGPGSGIDSDYYYFPGDGYGFGYGFGIRTEAGTAKPPAPGSIGELKWDGASGCYFVIDRKQEMMFVLLQQTFSERQRIQNKVKELIYDALEN